MRLKIWLTLGIAVLLVHLALINTLLPALPVVQTPTSPTFATRTVVPATAPLAPTTQALPAVPDQPITKPAKTSTRQPMAQTVTMSPAVETATASVGMAAAVSPASTGQASAPETEPVASHAPETLKVLTSAAVPSALAPGPEPGVLPTIQKAAFNTDALPASVKLMYRVDANKFPFRLSSELHWQQHERSYQARLSISAFGQSRVQTSRGQIDALGLAPERFSDKTRSEVAAHFNRAQGLVSFSANTPSVALQPGAQDRLSVLVQLAALVASEPQRFTPGTTLRVQTIGPREADLWLFTFGDMETLELPGGPQQGLKLVRQPRQTYDQKLEVWLAPGLAYLPARIRITEANGDYVDQKWAASEAADGT